MTSRVERNTLDWNDYGTNFSTTFKELLRDEELVDVTLVADGHLLNAHRLVLSALSPYFRKMFKQMPANQKAFVFLKDVSKQVADDLVTYIYNGEVNIASDGLSDFLNVAKALDIKGLNDGSYSQSREFNSRKRIRTMSISSECQYQSTHINQHLACKSTKPVQVCPTESNYCQSLRLDEDGNENANELNDHAQNMGTNIEHKNEYTGHKDDHFVNKGDGPSFSQWWNKSGNDSNSNQDIMNMNATIAKWRRLDDDSSDYDIIADIRTNEDGRQNLFYNGYKYFRKNKSENPIQRWMCTRTYIGKSCACSVRTLEINGVTMMKVLNDQHKHF